MGEVREMTVRRARVADSGELAELCALLWPDGPIEEHAAEIDLKLTTGLSGTLSVALFVAEEDESLVGFLEVGLRSHADGCDSDRPVAYVEGWFVREGKRGGGIGKMLMEAAEEWARKQRCCEMASDAIIGNDLSLHAHQALGFEVVDRCVRFRKPVASLGAGEPAEQ